MFSVDCQRMLTIILSRRNDAIFSSISLIESNLCLLRLGESRVSITMHFVFHKIVTACINFNKSSRSPFRVLSTSLAKCWFSDDTCSFMCCCTLRRTWKFSALLYLGSWNGESGPKKVSFNREVISEIEACHLSNYLLAICLNHLHQDSQEFVKRS